MNPLHERISGLSPEKRTLLAMRLLKKKEASTNKPDIPRRPASHTAPLSFAQQRLWFLAQLEPDSSFYNVPTVLRFRGDLDVPTLQHSISELVQRHEILRTTFVTVDDQPVQVIASPAPVLLPVDDLRHLAPTERETTAHRMALADAQQPFDLSHGPLLRVRLLQLDTTDYLVLFTMHHIITDGWSINVLLREVVTLYTTARAGEPSPLPDLPIQYADFAVWQREWLQGAVLEQQLAYWQQQLQGLPPLLELPSDRPRPAVQTSSGAMRSLTLPAPLADALRQLSQQSGCTLFMTLLAAFQVLLSRYSGQTDICVGTPIANRTRADLEPLIGFFVNTLVLRTDLSGNPTFRALLEQVREVTLGAYAHQDVPFELLVDTLKPVRSLSHSPLFQVMFILQNTPLSPQNLPDLAIEPVSLETNTTTFDLTLGFVDSPGELEGQIEYNTDLFDSTTIDRLVEHFRILLTGITNDPDQPIANLPLLTKAERRQVLIEWNNTALPYQHHQCIHSLIEAQVERTPTALALVAPAASDTLAPPVHMTYHDLNQRANQVAHALRTLGVGPETLVGVCLDRSPELIIALLGILKAGGAYVPLDPTYPAERLALMLSDAQVAVVLTQQDLIEHISYAIMLSAAENRLARHSARLLCIDTDQTQISRQPGTNPPSQTTSANLAYVIYTSGSTGTPKGVLVEHRSVVNHNSAVIKAFGLCRGDRVLQFATISFDVAVEEIFPTLISGATLVLCPDRLISSTTLLDLVESEEVTILNLPTAYWHAWMADLSRHYAPLPRSLRLVVVGGEQASSELLAAWQALAGAQVRWMNAYGPTEATVTTTLYELPADAGLAPLGFRVPIGRPIDNIQIYLLDDSLNPVPVGVVGELYIGGDGIARGYLHRPELTAEKFIPDPFSTIAGTRLYKSGDRARYLSDGTIEFLGRQDHQVKIRGFRIELDEIEAVMIQHPAVQEAVVLACATPTGTQQLVAYIVPWSTPDADNHTTHSDSADPGNDARMANTIHRFLRDRLPDYMLPTAWVFLSALPLTPNGKVNRAALPDLNRPPITSAEYTPPRTPHEETLAQIWSEILGHERIDIHANFFEIGGDSILSMQVIARAARADLHLTVRQFFQDPTIAGLATLVNTTEAIPAEQGAITGMVPLTPIQHWFFERHPLAPKHWNMSLFFEVGEGFDPNLIEQALEHLVIHHDALRLRFQQAEAGWQQMIAPPDTPVPFSRIDLSEVPPRKRTQAIEAQAAAWQASLNLEEGPMLRVVFFDLGPRQPGRLLIIFHHLVMDMVSMRIFLEDLQVSYLQLSRRTPITLPPKTVSFQHWARRLAEQAQSAALQQEVAYWMARPWHRAVPLPADFPQGAVTYGQSDYEYVGLSQKETQVLLQETLAAYQVQINAVLLTALVLACTRWTGQRTLLVEMDDHGRETIVDDTIDLSRTVGWFTTTFPVLFDLDNVQNPREALRAVQTQLQQIPNGGANYGLLRYLCDDPSVRAPLRSLPVPEVDFNYLGQFDQFLALAAPPFPIELAPESRGPEQHPESTRSAVLYVVSSITNGTLGVYWSYCPTRHKRSTIKRLAKNYLKELRALIHYSHSRKLDSTPFDDPDEPDDDESL